MCETSDVSSHCSFQLRDTLIIKIIINLFKIAEEILQIHKEKPEC
jgi:hypothetical protein